MIYLYVLDIFNIFYDIIYQIVNLWSFFSFFQIVGFLLLFSLLKENNLKEIITKNISQ